MLVASLGFAAAFALIFFRVPIAIALGTTGFIGFALLNGFTPSLSMIALAAQTSTMSYTLSVVPLFVLMGNLMAGTGISADLYAATRAWIGHRRGGLAMATILSCGGFAAVSGSSVATAITMARITIPSMRRYGYSDELATAVVAAGGTLGILIPPSVIMVIYGITTETHIGMLFAAGLIPGLIGILGYMLAVRWTVHRDPAAGPAAEASTAAEKRTSLTRVWAVIVLFAIVLGGIYGGLFTPTEAAGVGAAGALVLAIIRGNVSLRFYHEIFLDTVKTTAVLFALIFGAVVFGEFINFTGAHRGILAVVTDAALPPWTVILIILGIYLVLGCLLESLSMLLLTVPFFFPVVTGLGYDPVWFGVIVVIVIEIGLITPPLGVNLFIIKAAVPDVPMMTIMRGIVPFVAADIVRVLLVAFVPAISLWLPVLLFGG